jgi:hypothetical protein
MGVGGLPTGAPTQEYDLNHSAQSQGGFLHAGGMFVLAGVLALAAGPSNAGLISVDFGTTTSADGTGASPTISGAESAATAANAGFGAAHVWNGLAVGEYGQPASTNPSFAGLLDSTGAATGVGLSLTGGVKGFSGFNNPSSDALRKDYLFFNSGNNAATTLSWTLTGLIAGAAYDLFLYGSNGGNAGWSMAIGGSNLAVGGDSGTAHFSALVADANGMITGNVLPSGVYDADTDPFNYEVNWSGFQLLSTEVAPPTAPVPEPAGLTLVGAALLGLAFSRRSHRRPD